MASRAHLIVGGYPPGASAAHDMDYARLRLLELLAELDGVTTTVGSDYGELDKWLAGASFLITYVAGPVPSPEQQAVLDAWLQSGGRWFALHGTSGGRAARIEGSRQRRMVREPMHRTLGAFFLNHPPVRRFEVTVAAEHPLTKGLPRSFETVDELYLIEPVGESQVLLTTELPEDPSPPGFGFLYDEDTSLQADGRTRVLGLTKDVGAGAVAYVALGHCHSPVSNTQPFVEESVAAGGVTPKTLRGSWEVGPFQTLLGNAMRWGLVREGSAT